MELTITGNNIVSNGKQLHGVILNNHVMLPSNEDFVIFDNEEQKKFVLQAITQCTDIKLKYDNAILVSEADSITDNTEFVLESTVYNLYEAVAKLINSLHVNINDVYTIDLRFLRFFKNIKNLSVYAISDTVHTMIIDCTNIITISQLHHKVVLLHTDNIKYIKSCSGVNVLNKTISFPALETLESYSFASSHFNNILNLGKITIIPESCFTGATIYKIVLPQTCHTIMEYGFNSAYIYNKLISDYVKIIKKFAFNSIQIKVLSFPNLELLDNGDSDNASPCISQSNMLQKIESLGKITLLPKYAITNIYNLTYIDIPATVTEIHTYCLSNLGSYQRSTIYNTLDFSNVTNIQKFALSSIYATTIIFPATFEGSANLSPIFTNLQAKKIVNANTCGQINNTNPETEVVLTNHNNYDNVTSSELYDFSGAYNSVYSQSYTFTDSTVPQGVTTTYTRPTYNYAFSCSYRSFGKFTVNTTYIKAIQYVTVYKELNLSDNIECMQYITYLGSHLRLPENLKYISYCTFPNIRTIEYSSKMLIKMAWSGVISSLAPLHPNMTPVRYSSNFILPCEFLTYSAITGFFIEDGETIRLPEGIKYTNSGGLNIMSNTCRELILPSTMTHFMQGSCNMPNLETLTVLSDSFTCSSMGFSGFIKHLNIDNCRYLYFDSALSLDMEILEFPATLELLTGVPVLNPKSRLKKIIFNGNTELRQNALYFTGNPTTVRELINIHLAFANSGGGISGMSNLEKITFANNLPNSTTLNNYLANKKYLRIVELPNTLTRINAYALYKTAISEIDIPAAVEFISYTAFKQCSNLRTMIVRATTPPTAEETDKNRVSNVCTIYVPAESLQLYKESPYWRAQANQIEAIDDETLSAANQVFYTIKQNNITL